MAGRQIFASVALLLAVFASGFAHAPAAPAAGGGCRDACYAGKSRAYQRCRVVPPSDREARSRCFRQADATLEACLRGCK